MYDPRDLADEARTTDDNDEFTCLHRLAQQITSVPDDGPGPVPDETREAVAEAIESLDGPLIPESEFEDYARDLAEDIGAVPRSYSWPASCIDWERAANDLLMDYIEYDYNGTTVYCR